MAALSEDISNARALVVESNPSMRSVLVAQMRDLGVGTVVQCARLVDARRHLELAPFDFVLCELHFPNEDASGQDLLDELRRNQLLPFSTVFIMITASATYASVAEAAESALDGYLLKPLKPSQLADRLQQARLRKVSLQDIFSAIEAGDFEQAASMCVRRFAGKEPYWLYAARMGAELFLRINRPARARQLYEAILKAKPVPWAQLGVARAMLDGGQTAAAVHALEQLVRADAQFADAYDVLARAQFELGKFEAALATCEQASQLTPASIGRLQSLGTMAFYAGQFEEAERALQRTCLLGLGSKIFDGQSLVLMAMVYCERGDHKALQRCAHDLAGLVEKYPDALRPRRLAKVVDTLCLLQHHKIAAALDAVRGMVQDIRQPGFDCETACNLVGVLAQLAKRNSAFDEAHATLAQLATRFCCNRVQYEMLINATHAHPAYADELRAGNAKIIRYAEYAMSLSLQGNPAGAVQELIARGEETLNSKLLESAEMVLARYSEKIGEAPALYAQVAGLRALCAAEPSDAPGEGARKAGALNLRVGASAARRKTTSA